MLSKNELGKIKANRLSIILLSMGLDAPEGHFNKSIIAIQKELEATKQKNPNSGLFSSGKVEADKCSQ